MGIINRIIFLAFVLFFAEATSLYPQETKNLVILHTNDMHSRLDGFSPSLRYSPATVNDDNTVGGFSRLATVLRSEREKDPANTLTVDAGDFLMGTVYHYMEEYNGFQLPLMALLGYEVVAIGNHEFDYGPGKLARIINVSSDRGPIPSLMLGNAVFDASDTGDDELEKLFSKEIIRRSTILEKDGTRIGIFSLMGIDADDVAPYAPPLTFSKQVRSARRLVKDLRSQGCDIVICLSHSGVEKDKKGRWAGEDVKLAKKVKGLDVIISGHTHTRLDQPIVVRGVPIVQAGSYAMSVGRLELDLTGGSVSVAGYSLIPVDDSVQGDTIIQQMIDIQKNLISAKLMEPLGYDLEEIIVEADFEVVCDEYGGDLENSNLGPMVADAIYKYVNSHSAAGTDISMVAAGVIRDRLVPGELTVQDIFRVMSLGSGSDTIPGYPLATVYVTGRELKSIIEILLIAYKSSPSNFCYYSGLEVDFNPEKGLLRKINSIKIIGDDKSVKEVDFDRKNQELYSITANAYMLEFIGIIKKTTFGFVNVVPKMPDGTRVTDMKYAIIDFDLDISGIQEGKEWIALTELLKGMDDLNGNGIADIDRFYLKPPYRIIPLDKGR